MVFQTGWINVRVGKKVARYQVDLLDWTVMKEIWKIKRDGEEYLLSNNRPIFNRHGTGQETLTWKNERRGGLRSAFMQEMVAALDTFIKENS